MMTPGMIFAAGALLTLLGVTVQWQLPRRRMSMEERKKDGRLTEAQAERRIWLQSMMAPWLTIVGAALMVSAAWGWL